MILLIFLLLQVKVSISQIVIGSACDNSRDFAIKCSPNGGLAYCSDSVWYEQPCVTGSTCKYDSVAGASCIKACNEPRSTIYRTLTSTRIVSSTRLRSTIVTSAQRTTAPLTTSSGILISTSLRLSTTSRTAASTTPWSTLTTMFRTTTTSTTSRSTTTSTTSKSTTFKAATTTRSSISKTASTMQTSTRSTTRTTMTPTSTKSSSSKTTSIKPSTTSSKTSDGASRTTPTTTTLPTIQPIPSINTTVMIEVDYHVLNYVGVNVSLPNFAYDPYETSKVKLVLPLRNENDEVLSIKSEQLTAFRCEYLLQYSDTYYDDQWVSCDWSQQGPGLSLSWVYIANNVTSYQERNTAVTLSAQLMMRTSALSEARIFESPIVESFIDGPKMNSSEMFAWQPTNGTIEPVVAWKQSSNFDQNNYDIQHKIRNMEDSDSVNEEPSLKMPLILSVSTLGGGVLLFLLGSTMTSITAYRLCTKEKAID